MVDTPNLHFGNLREFTRASSLTARCVEIGLFTFEYSSKDGEKPYNGQALSLSGGGIGCTPMQEHGCGAER